KISTNSQTQQSWSSRIFSIVKRVSLPNNFKISAALFISIIVFIIIKNLLLTLTSSYNDMLILTNKKASEFFKTYIKVCKSNLLSYFFYEFTIFLILICIVLKDFMLKLFF